MISNSVIQKQKNPNFCSEPVLIYKNGKIYCWLKPIQHNYETYNYNAVRLISKWRKENPTISASKFKVTEERTKNWLNNHVLQNNKRLLYMIYDLDNTPLGHVGFTNINFENKTIDLDSILRGEKNYKKGLMSFCVNKLIEIAYDDLKMQNIKLTVFSDNYSAIKFYEKLNFVGVKKIPLIKIKSHNEIRYVESKNESNELIEKYYLIMKHNK